jgi:hypothetical protein
VTLERAWKAEVEAAIAGGLPWRVVSVWCSATSAIRSAELADAGTGTSRVIAVSVKAFATPAQRRTEILRQLRDGRATVR